MIKEAIVLAILGIALILQFFLNQKKFTSSYTKSAAIFKQKIFGYFFAVVLLLGAAVFLYLTIDYYRAWRGSGNFLQYLIPPFQKPTYLLGYVINHFTIPYLISLGVALVFLGAANFLNHRYESRFFEAEEPYLGALAIFLLGQSYLWIYYLAGFILFYLIFHLFNRFWRRQSERLPLYWLWLPAALLVIIIKGFLFL